MNLHQVLGHVNQIEKSKFINCLDKVSSEAIGKDKDLAQRVANIDGQLRTASGSEITHLFSAASKHFEIFVRDQISLGGPQVSLLVNILSRDGNSVARISWIERLYSNEHKRMDKLSKEILKEIKGAENSNDFNCRSLRLLIYKDCFESAYNNDLRQNREQKVSDDERIILNMLSNRLGITKDETFAIENLICPVSKNDVQLALNFLREIGVIFVKRKQEVLLPDEIFSLLHRIQNKELSDKYSIRVLRSLSDAELSNILRAYGQKIRGVPRQDKISFVIHSGVSIRNVLLKNMFENDATQNARKERLKGLIEELGINTPRLGTTLDDRIDIIINSLKTCSKSEMDSLSTSGFNELISFLSEADLSFLKKVQEDFEIENNEALDADRLRVLGISPVDILYVFTNEDIRKIRDKKGLSKRGNPRTVILECFASANDKLIENYELLATRNLAALHAEGINIREADLGQKFEEITKAILEQLGLNIDEDKRKQINTAKDKADIIISLGDDDVIIGEAKSYKNGDFSKYSSTSRQVKAYVKRCEANNMRVAQVLIVAPKFSQDFIESAEMDADINISLLEAGGLKKILDAYKTRRNPKFSANLLSKGGLLKADLIAKTI